jgi:hypothetical protein
MMGASIRKEKRLRETVSIGLSVIRRQCASETQKRMSIVMMVKRWTSDGYVGAGLTTDILLTYEKGGGVKDRWRGYGPTCGTCGNASG